MGRRHGKDAPTAMNLMTDIQAQHRADLLRLLASPPEKHTSELIGDLVALGNAMGHDVGNALLVEDPTLLDRRPGLQQQFGSFIVEREIEEAYRLRDADIPPGTRFRDVAGPHAAGTYDRLREVFARLDFSNVRKAVMVGCGWRPVTTLHMHDETRVPEVVGLDNVEDAVDCARILGRKFGCDRLRVELADALTYDYSDTQVVYVASMVTPKADVVARIADTAPPEAQIVLWEPVSLARLWMQSAMEPLDPRLEVVDTGSVNWLSTEVFVRFRGSAR
jgi:hypothetical protein